MKTNSCLRKKLIGFTLIEVLIVISIVSILSSIALFYMHKYQKESAKVTLISDTKNCFNTCLAKLSSGSMECMSSDCVKSQNTLSCTIDTNGPVYVKCDGKNIIKDLSCYIYQDGRLSCT